MIGSPIVPQREAIVQPRHQSPVLRDEITLAVLEFDHRDSVAKVADVSALMRRAVSQRMLEAELQKCDVVCANCHRRRTAERGGFWRQAVSEKVEQELRERSAARLSLLRRRSG